jgi:hypothetical protein
MIPKNYNLRFNRTCYRYLCDFLLFIFLNLNFLSSDGDEVEPQQININDFLPRVDISPQVTEALLAELADKNWKTRNEGLLKIQGNSLKKNTIIFD